LQLAVEPACFVIESRFAGEIAERAVARLDFESCRRLKLAQADGTEMERRAVQLGEMIGAVHQAGVESAVLHAKHVAGLVREDLRGAAECEGAWRRRFLSRRPAVAGEAVDSNPPPQIRLPEDVVPVGSGVKIWPGADSRVVSGALDRSIPDYTLAGSAKNAAANRARNGSEGAEGLSNEPTGCR